MRQLRRLKLRGAGYSDEEIRLYKLEDRPEREAADYLSTSCANRVVKPALNGMQLHILEDKWAAQLFLSALGIPGPPLLGLYHPLYGMTPEGAPLTTPDDCAALLRPRLPARLFLKTRGGGQGVGARSVMVAEGAGGVLLCTDREGTRTLADYLAGLPMGPVRRSYSGWLIQGFVAQHPVLDAYNAGTLNTLRMLTYRHASGAVELQAVLLRMGRTDSTVDSWAQGGLLVEVDPETGVLGRGLIASKQGGSAHVETHPDSGVRIVGQALPHWAAARALCEKAARALPGVRSVGWDVAIGPEGPVLVEGNAFWSTFVQLISGPYLDPGRRAVLKADGITLPERLPPLPVAVINLAMHRSARSMRSLARRLKKAYGPRPT